MSAMDAGAPVRLTVRREGKDKVLKGVAKGAPKETYPGAVVEYGAVPFQGGLLRDIYVKPAADFKGPVVFLVQGYTCASVEKADPNHYYRRLISALLARGIAVYRVEKPHMGDSRGGPDCKTSDFDTEVAAFSAGYRALMADKGVTPDRVFLFGHSMGGLEAPILASKVASPRGVAVFGVIARSWTDYMQNLSVVQLFWTAGQDPVEAAEAAEKWRDDLAFFHASHSSPVELVKTRPHLDEALRDLGWTGTDDFLGRHYSFWQGVAQAHLPAAWRDTKSRVLSIYGETDTEALTSEEQRYLVDIVNYYRPGTARFVEIPRTGHGMNMTSPPDELKRRAWETKKPVVEPRVFNPEIAKVLADWIDESMAAPPVAAGAAPKAS
jgi:hypothetical protein